MKISDLNVARFALTHLADAVLKPEMGIKIHRILQELNSATEAARQACTDADKKFVEFKKEELGKFPLLDPKLKNKDSSPEKISQQEEYDNIITTRGIEVHQEKQVVTDQEIDFTLKSAKLKMSDIEKAVMREKHGFSFSFLQNLEEFIDSNA